MRKGGIWSMLVAERQQKIVEIVNKRKSVTVAELSKIFSVTEETIRRDLEKLQNEKKLLRSHGGAVSIQSNDSLEIPYPERESTNVKEKYEIANEAVKHVKQGDKIILDASTTAWYMAKALPDIPITVLTNSIKVAIELSTKSNIEVISVGGILLPRSLSYAGPLAESSMDLYHLDKAFISCKGLHLERGLSESSEQQARIKKKMIENVDQVYILIDYSKFGVKAFSKISDLDVIDYIITDSKADNNILEKLASKSVQIIKTQ